jgi:serine/threonine-protein kinase HipA
MLGVETGDSDEHRYTEIIDVLRQHGADAQSDIEELWRRVAFFILINNVDDHLHNHGFLHAARGQWRLAPAFDINPFPERARELKTWISEQSGPEASVESLMSISAYCRIDLPKAKSILRSVNQAVGKWRERGHEIGMTEFELDQFSDAFHHRQAASARRITG